VAVYGAALVVVHPPGPPRVPASGDPGAPRPRTVETLSEAGFVATKKRSLEIFQREVRR
jgi:NitT/TauT family transport system ATP-binding protein